MSFNAFIPVKELNAQQLSIYREASGNLKVKIEGEIEEYLFKPIKCFPLSDAEHYLGLYKVTPEGEIKEEIAIIADFNRLEENSRKLLAEELGKAYSLAWIKRIYSIAQTNETSKWHVDADRGEQTFEVRHQSEIYTIPPSLMVIEDIEGNIFLVEADQLDPKSHSLLELYR